MGFKLIFEPLKAKIPLSQIFKKMKNLTFGTKKKAIKTTMGKRIGPFSVFAED